MNKLINCVFISMIPLILISCFGGVGEGLSNWVFEEEENPSMNIDNLIELEKSSFYDDFTIKYNKEPTELQKDSINANVDSLVNEGWIVNGENVTEAVVSYTEHVYYEELGTNALRVTCTYDNHQKTIISVHKGQPLDLGFYKIGDKVLISYDIDDSTGGDWNINILKKL